MLKYVFSQKDMFRVQKINQFTQHTYIFPHTLNRDKRSCFNTVYIIHLSCIFRNVIFDANVYEMHG